MSDIPSSQSSGTGNPIESKKLTIGSTKLFAAKALAKKPAKVTPTCMVARNLPGSHNSFASKPAFLSPSSAIILSLLSLRVIRAISDAAKKAFINISKNNNKIADNKL